METKTCRLCLRKEGEFFELFDETMNLMLVDEVNEILNIEIHHDVRLPSAICSNCYKIQAFFKEFRLSCLKVNNYLIGQLDSSRHHIDENFPKLTGPPVKYETFCYNQITEEENSISLKLIAEKVNKENVINDEDNENSEQNFSNLKRNESVGTYKSLSFSRSRWNGSEDCLIQAVDDMPPLVRIDIKEVTECHKLISPSEDNENIITSKDAYTSTTDEDFVMSESNVQKSPEKEVPCEESELLEDCVEGSSDTYIWRKSNELVSTEKLLCTSGNTFPSESSAGVKQTLASCVSGSKIREKDSERDSESAIASINSFSTSIDDEYQLKHEEIILAEPECDEESHYNEEPQYNEVPQYNKEPQYNEEPQSDDGEPLEDLLLYEHNEQTYEVTILQNKSAPIMNEFVINNPNKIRSCGIEFSKATINTLMSMQEAGVKLSPKVIKETALKVAANHGLTHFTASNGWLISFYKRHNIDPKFGDIKLTQESLQAKTLSNRYILRYCCEELNEATFEACCDILSTGAELSGNLIKDIASKIAVKEGLLEFSATIGWLNSFKKKFQIFLRGQKNPLKHLTQ